MDFESLKSAGTVLALAKDAFTILKGVGESVKSSEDQQLRAQVAELQDKFFDIRTAIVELADLNDTLAKKK